MKKLICILMMLLFVFPALAEGALLAEGAPLAEENPFDPFILTAPEGVTLEDNEGTMTFVSGMTRIVAMVIDRVPDENPAEAIVRLMGQFEPDAVLGDELALEGGHAGLTSRTADKYGEGVHQWNVMILSPGGGLLILSGYNLEGDDDSVHALLDALLAAISADGAPIVIK